MENCTMIYSDQMFQGDLREFFLNCTDLDKMLLASLTGLVGRYISATPTDRAEC